VNTSYRIEVAYDNPFQHGHHWTLACGESTGCTLRQARHAVLTGLPAVYDGWEAVRIVREQTGEVVAFYDVRHGAHMESA
jgi:hypothetical protein